MKKSVRKAKRSWHSYLPYIVIALLLLAAFFTVVNALQYQQLHSTAATLPPNAQLPTEQECAAKVIKTSERIPENQQANNNNVYQQGYHLSGSELGKLGGNYESRVTGNFSGTTDEIIQWAACKWGFDPDTVRAQAVSESSWKQSMLGDCNRGGQTQPETNGCQSVGLLQIKSGNIPPTHPGTWPYAHTSTAFNVDYTLALRRACFDGKETWLGGNYAAGDEWGCIGRWFSGSWHDSGAEQYIAGVKQHLAGKDWGKYGSVTTDTSNSSSSSTTNNPTFGALGSCPSCASPSTPPTAPSTTSPSTNPSASPSSIQPPCNATQSRVDEKKNKKHHDGEKDSFKALPQLLLELFTLLVKLLGGASINSSNIANPTSTPPQPC